VASWKIVFLYGKIVFLYGSVVDQNPYISRFDFGKLDPDPQWEFRKAKITKMFSFEG
jgi:hypothetical protein